MRGESEVMTSVIVVSAAAHPVRFQCALAVCKRNTDFRLLILKDRNFLGITSRVEINRNLSMKVRALDFFPD